MSKILRLGDVVIDATAGNGHDTLFLVKCVGQTGKVYSFDVQKSAIDNTKKRILEEGFEKNVVIINDGHENLDKYVTEKVGGVMFNLGYLPKGNKNIVTQGETTVMAVKKSLKLLRKKGLITICVYTAHNGGKMESSILESYLNELDNKDYKVWKYFSKNDVQSPYILLIYKII